MSYERIYKMVVALEKHIGVYQIIADHGETGFLAVRAVEQLRGGPPDSPSPIITVVGQSHPS